jgi:predicted secreted protein
MRYIATLALALTGLLAACSGLETRPGDTEAFAAGNYTYYSWRSEPLENKGQSTDMIYALDPLLRQAVDRELAEKGYVLDADKAQFSVDYIYAPGLRLGQAGQEASNLETYPSAVANRQVNQAVVDNAHALGGVKEISNIGLQFNDESRREEVWRVVITKIVENTNTIDNDRLQHNVNEAIAQGLKTLPANH